MTVAQPQRVLITGARGQVGTELQQSKPAGVELVALDRTQLDIGDRAAVLDMVARVKPDIIINAAAYTAVDKAESERDIAFRINGEAPGHFAEAAAQVGARLIHISTDYVFDGTQSTPYKPDDAPNPINVYGASKLAGERVVADRTEGRALIVRTSWVYAKSGHNFVNTMLRLMRERDEVRVVCDQIGTPTHAASLARALWKFAALPDTQGVYHWTDAGVASWYDFAVAIGAHVQSDRGPVVIRPIMTAEYPTAARRPACGILAKSATWQRIGQAAHWTTELRSCLGG